MRWDHAQELFESILPFDYIEEHAVALGVQKRKRLFDPARSHGGRARGVLQGVR